MLDLQTLREVAKEARQREAKTKKTERNIGKKVTVKKREKQKERQKIGENWKSWSKSSME